MKKIPMSASPMSRWMIGTYLRIYPKNDEKQNSVTEALNPFKQTLIIIMIYWYTELYG